MGVLQDNLVNVYGHTKTFLSYRNYDTKDNSQNNYVLGYLCWGQGWHNNHHHDPKAFDFGRGISHNAREIDLCVMFLPFLGKPNS
jgi:stearoyl-CoA desaturase (delta-9 desaturase)